MEVKENQIKDIGDHLESLGFIRQEFDEDWSEAIAFKNFLIMPEFPNGGMTALSVMDTVSKRWYSLPTGLKKYCPKGVKNFDYDQSEEAIAWLKEEIERFERTVNAKEIKKGAIVKSDTFFQGKTGTVISIEKVGSIAIATVAIQLVGSTINFPCSVEHLEVVG